MFFFLMKVWHYSLPQAGLAVSPGPLLVVPVAMVTGRMAARLGHRPLLVAGSLLCVCGGLWLYGRVGPTPDFPGVWLPGLAMTGGAVGLVLPACLECRDRRPLAARSVRRGHCGQPGGTPDGPRAGGSGHRRLGGPGGAPDR